MVFPNFSNHLLVFHVLVKSFLNNQFIHQLVFIIIRNYIQKSIYCYLTLNFPKKNYNIHNFFFQLAFYGVFLTSRPWTHVWQPSLGWFELFFLKKINNFIIRHWFDLKLNFIIFLYDFYGIIMFSWLVLWV
jgi:hypothetical protein